MVGHHMRANEIKLVYGHHVSIVRETRQSKYRGHNILHRINIVSVEEKSKIQGVVYYHHINKDIFPSQNNRKLRKDS